MSAQKNLQQYSKHVLNTWWIISIGYMNTDFRMELKNASDIISEVSSIFSCYPSVILCWILLDVRFCIVSINSGSGAVRILYIVWILNRERNPIVSQQQVFVCSIQCVISLLPMFTFFFVVDVFVGVWLSWKKVKQR